MSVEGAFLTEAESNLVRSLTVDLGSFQARNRRLWQYYDGKAGLKNMGIAVPEELANVEAVVGWPEIIVDALAERIEWSGWRSERDISGLEAVFAENQLDHEVSKAVLDSLVTGVGFLTVSAGAEGEPDVVVDAVPATEATYRWDDRLNRMAAGLVSRRGPNGELLETLYLPDVTVSRIVDGEGERVERYVHGRGRCGLIVLPNRVRSESCRGRSEISRAVRYYTDHGVRTILGMEYNREFYTTPQRYLTNVTHEQMGVGDDPDARDLVELGWKVAMNKALIVPPGEEGDSGSPQVGEFSAASPAPYIDELKMLAQLVSAQSGVPAAYLGFVSDNPTSADAIRASEARLVKKAEMRQASFGKALVNDLAFVCQSIVDGVPPGRDFIASLSSVWREASTPTLAATMDAMVKAVQAGVIPKGSEVVLDRVGFTEAEKQVIRREVARQQSTQRLVALAGQEPVATPMTNAEDGFVPGGDSSGV